MKRLLKIAVQLILFALPWGARRRMLESLFNWVIPSSAGIGYSILLVRRLKLEPNSRIGSLNFIKGLEVLELGEHSSIGNLNWITAFPISPYSDHFKTELNRFPALRLGKHCAITNRHLIDCTNEVVLGEYSTFAGFRSQLLTHSIDIAAACQRSAPVTIGSYCFIGTGSILLPGSVLPDFCVLAAGSVMTEKLEHEFSLYGGVPARKIKELSRGSAYFTRTEGFIF